MKMIFKLSTSKYNDVFRVESNFSNSIAVVLENADPEDIFSDDDNFATFVKELSNNSINELLDAVIYTLSSKEKEELIAKLS